MKGQVDWDRVLPEIDNLYASVDVLQSLFPGRKFTPDGHLVGSLGEVIAAYMFDLELHAASTMGHDAIAPDGRGVEIKLTQRKSVAIRHEPEHLLVLARPADGSAEVVYNGPGGPAWHAAGAMQRNGQRSISLLRLRRLADGVDPISQLKQVRDTPI